MSYDNSCSVDTDCYGCPVEYSRLTTNGKCVNGECYCCTSDADCQDGYSCDGSGFCYTDGDYCVNVGCGDNVCSRNEQGYVCYNECDSDCNSLGTCNYDNICSANENSQSCSDCYSSTQERCGYHSDGSENYCHDGGYCADYNNGWCCDSDRKICPGDQYGNCIENWKSCDDMGTQPQGYCGDGICQDGEYNCHDDCGGTGSGMCGDGICDEFERENGGCHDDCGRPPEERLPENCWYEYRFGKEVVKCEKENMCPDESEMDRMKRDCKEEGGNPIYEKDPYNGCSFVHCEFGDKFEFGQGCPSDADLERETDRCFNIGGNPVPKMMGGGFGSEGCNVIVCEGRGFGPNICAEYDNPSIKDKFYYDCGGKQNTVVDIDPEGCPITRCGDPVTEGLKEVPERAYEGCPGDLLLDKDENGIVMGFECIFKGGSEYTMVSRDEVTKIPEIEDVLAVAMRLEGMNAKFIDLSEKINDLALFYRGKANSASGETKEKYELEAKRFEKVADLMVSAGDKFDVVRDEIKEIAMKDELTTYDIVSLKTSIRKLKEETIRSIIFAMLGDADEVAEEYSINVNAETVEESDLTDIGSDGWKFDQAFRTCEPVLFYPDGVGGGPSVKINGKNDAGNCIMVIDMTDDMGDGGDDGPPDEFIEFMAEKAGVALEKNSAGDYIIDMVCEISDYQNGMPMGNGPDDGPPTEFFEDKCTGLGFEFMKMGPQDGGPNDGPGEPKQERQTVANSYCGDGLCDFDEQQTCPNDCGGFQDDFKDQYDQGYDQNPQDQYYDQGGDQYYDQGPPQGGDYYPQDGGFNDGQKCPDGFCDQWESEGEGRCIPDCGY